MEARRINDESIPDPPTAGDEWDSAAGSDDDDPNDLSPPNHKGKRSRHGEEPNGSTPPPHSFTEEEELANCLVILSSSRIKPVLRIADAEKPSTSGSKEVNDDFLPPLPPHSTLTPPIPPEMFECKGCKKVFVSHQALGGHRASHKKVKGCFAARLESEAPEADTRIIPSPENMAPLSIVPLAKKSPQSSAKNKSKFHECSVCQRLFPTGQALGGHKRCHWITSKTNQSGAAAVEPLTAPSANVMLPQMLDQSDHALDLNMQAPADDVAGVPFVVDVPAVIYLQSGWSVEKKTKEEEKRGSTGHDLDDEAESKEMKVGELSHLKDMSEEEESSTWLKIGMESTAKL